MVLQSYEPTLALDWVKKNTRRLCAGEFGPNSLHGRCSQPFAAHAPMNKIQK
jgi:hypothetical protein